MCHRDPEGHWNRERWLPKVNQSIKKQETSGRNKEKSTRLLCSTDSDIW